MLGLWRIRGSFWDTGVFSSGFLYEGLAGVFSVFLGDVYVFEEPVGFLCVGRLGFGLGVFREVNLRV